MGREWWDRPVVQQMLDVIGRIDADFATEAGVGEPRRRRLDEAPSQALRARADQNCAALR
jgi:hypothetical protein